MERLRDRTLQFAASWSLGQGNGGQGVLGILPIRKLGSTRKPAVAVRERAQVACGMEHGAEITDEEMLHHALATCLDVDGVCETSKERPRRSLDSSIDSPVIAFRSSSRRPTVDRIWVADSAIVAIGS